jgi:uncharacterized protein (TIGR02145 family)
MKTLSKISILILSILIINSCKKDKPVLPLLSTASISVISTTSAVSGGTVSDDGGAAIISAGVCWNTSDNPDITNNKTTTNSVSGAFTCNIAQLNPGTTYYVRAYATNSAGTGYGSSVSFKTLGDKPAPNSLKATEILTTSASLNATINPNSLSTAVTFEYGLTTDYTSTSIPSQSPLTGASDVSVSVSLTGLNPGKLYHFRIKAENSLGITISDDMTFTTLGQAPSVISQSVSNITMNSATVNGFVNPGYLSTTANFEYGTNNFGNSVSPVQTLVATGESQSVTAVLSGLTAGTTYYFRIAATNELGTGNGEFLTFTTLDIPILSTNFLSNITTSSASGGGIITSDYGAPISQRGLCWNTTTNPTISDNKAISGSSSANFSVDLSGLTPNTIYYLRAFATNAAGTGYGEERVFKTFTGTVTDIDGITYNTVTIGSRVWMAENLRTTHFLNGDPIPNITDNTTWYSLPTPAYCYYKNDPTTPAVMGLLYNWYTTADSRNLCPSGWHVSTDAEWQDMVASLGGDSIAGGKLKLPGLDFWLSPNTGADNSSGFSAVSGGQRGIDGNFFNGAGAFWTSTSENINSGRDWFLLWNYASATRYYDKKVDGFNIRCVKD